MRLFIQIRDGQPYEHPILFDNFVAAFPDVDVDNLPSEFAEFKRYPPPFRVPALTKIVNSYVWKDGYVADQWDIVPMIGQERDDAINQQTEYVNNVLEFRKQEAAQKIQDAATDEERAAFESHLANLNSVQVVDPFNTAIPTPPFQLEDGTWSTMESSGSSPNVID